MLRCSQSFDVLTIIIFIVETHDSLFQRLKLFNVSQAKINENRRSYLDCCALHRRLSWGWRTRFRNSSQQHRDVVVWSSFHSCHSYIKLSTVARAESFLTWNYPLRISCSNTINDFKGARTISWSWKKKALCCELEAKNQTANECGTVKRVGEFFLLMKMLRWISLNEIWSESESPAGLIDVRKSFTVSHDGVDRSWELQKLFFCDLLLTTANQNSNFYTQVNLCWNHHELNSHSH